MVEEHFLHPWGYCFGSRRMGACVAGERMEATTRARQGARGNAGSSWCRDSGVCKCHMLSWVSKTQVSTQHSLSNLLSSARIPQIWKNYRDKSCEGESSDSFRVICLLTIIGLAPLFFMLSTMGNTTYGAGILLHSQDPDYLVTNLPWLIGSIGTIAEDCIIFVQFHLYKPKKPSSEAIE